MSETQKKRYLVRLVGDYSLVVAAENAVEAKLIAKDTPLSEWGVVWADDGVEELPWEQFDVSSKKSS